MIGCALIALLEGSVHTSWTVITAQLVSPCLYLSDIWPPWLDLCNEEQNIGLGTTAQVYLEKVEGANSHEGGSVWPPKPTVPTLQIKLCDLN